MPDEVPMVTSCPLCLSPDEVQSMVTVEIERAIAGGRTAIMICRSCALAVVEAGGKADPPLLSTLIYDATLPSAAPPVEKSVWDKGIRKAVETWEESQAESAKLHEGEDPDNGTSTD